MGLPKSYLSASQITKYLTCPAQYYFRYIKEIPFVPNAKITKGSSVHKGIEYNLRQKISTEKDLPVDEVVDFAVCQYEELAEGTLFEKNERAEVKGEVAEMTKFYMETIANKIHPVMVEQRLEIDFQNTDYTLLGFVDVIDQYGNIRDLKTSGRKPAESIIHDNIQLSIYSLLYRQVFELQETNVILDYLVQNKKGINYYSLSKKVTDEDIQRMLAIMGSVASSIENKVFYPNPTSKFCGKSCEFYKECHAQWGELEIV